MRKLMVGIVVVVAGAAQGAAGAAATTTGWNASVHGNAPFEFATARCSFVEQRIDGARVTRAGIAPAKLWIDSCVTANGSGYTLSGTFTIVTARGNKLTGTVDGTLPTGATVMPFSGTLHVTGGTGEYAHASGSLGVNGTFAGGQPNPTVARADLTMSGVISY